MNATSSDLKKIIGETVNGCKFIVVTQRESYIHTRISPNEIRAEKGMGGVLTLLDGVLKTSRGTMIALGVGNADQDTVDAENRIKVPPENPKYSLRRVFLAKGEYDKFYYGFSNQTFWPLSHAVFVQPKFNLSWWRGYVKANKRFAEAVLAELGDRDGVIWVNDYQFSLLPKMLKAAKPSLKVGLFWHIPWPTHEVFRICPWRKQIMEGMLGADFIGFHRGYHVENFVQCAKRDLGIIEDNEPRSVEYEKNTTRLANIPASVDYEEIEKSLEHKSKNTVNLYKLLKEDTGEDILPCDYITISVDRIDYTKGILERLRIIEKLLELYPEYRGKFMHIFIGIPSRLKIQEYNSYYRSVKRLIRKINARFSSEKWQPIRFIDKTLERKRIFSYFSFSNACLVTSLDDGMNLVAKEFVIACNPKKGMLMLSKFTGAAKDLTRSVLINPYDISGSVSALNETLKMSVKEKYERNMEMKEILKKNNIYQWAIDFLKNLVG